MDTSPIGPYLNGIGLWILELKDREFGPGDAHPFRYRRVRYNADKAIIVTAAKVSEEAKRIFRELDAPRRGGNLPDSGDMPVYVEGLGAVSKDFKKEVNQASFDAAIQALQLPSIMTGFDLPSVITSRTAKK